jgi:aldehyde:ferredoxin oxidoreductase
MYGGSLTMNNHTECLGFWSRICTVDLSAGTVDFQDLDKDQYRRFLSGIGLGAKVLWDRMAPGADPLGPGNILGFTTGLLTDTGASFAGRFTVVGKSPASGGWGDANSGGYFAPFLKRCGVDGLFFTGVSSSPV